MPKSVEESCRDLENRMKASERQQEKLVAEMRDLRQQVQKIQKEGVQRRGGF